MHMFLSGSVHLRGKIFMSSSRVDWRERGAVTPVKDQGGYGTCWAFGTVGALEGIIKIKHGIITDLSAQQLVNAHYRGEIKEKNGVAAIDWIATNGGLTAFEYLPYVGFHKEPKLKKPLPIVTPVFRCTELDYLTDRALQKIVYQQPVMAGIYVGLQFDEYIGGIYRGPRDGLDLDSTHHSVLVVGYDVDWDGTPYWIVKNSYGKEWGEEGYMRMLRDPRIMGGVCGITDNIVIPHIIE